MLTIDPTNSAVLYAGTRGGGVFKSTDSGAHWTLAASGLGNLDVLAIAVDWSTPGTVSAATNGGGIFKSVDGGSNWAAANVGITLPLTTQSIAIDPVNAQVIYVGRGGANKIFKSVNGGSSWTNMSSGLPALPMSVRSIAIDPSAPSTLYMATTGAGVFRSTDGAATWQATGQ